MTFDEWWRTYNSWPQMPTWRDTRREAAKAAWQAATDLSLESAINTGKIERCKECGTTHTTDDCPQCAARTRMELKAYA